MAYEKQTWKNLPDQTTPISAERLTHMEDGIAGAYSLIFSKEITLIATSWTATSTNDGYEYTVQDTNVTADDLVIITMTRENQKKFTDGDVKSAVGSFIITTTTAPTEDVAVNYTIVKTTKEGDET